MRRGAWSFAIAALAACSKTYGSAPDAADAGVPEATAPDAATPSLVDAGAAGDAGPSCTVLVDEPFTSTTAWMTEQEPTGVGALVARTGAAFPTSALYVDAMSSASQVAELFLYEIFPNISFSTATLEYDFIWTRVDGYTEFGCTLDYGNASEYIGVGLRRNTGDTPIYGALNNSAKANGLSLQNFGEGVAHHIIVVLTATGTSFTATMTTDGTPASPPSATIEPTSPLTDLSVKCGDTYLSQDNLEDTVVIDNVKLTTCP